MRKPSKSLIVADKYYLDEIFLPSTEILIEEPDGLPSLLLDQHGEPIPRRATPRSIGFKIL